MAINAPQSKNARISGGIIFTDTSMQFFQCSN